MISSGLRNFARKAGSDFEGLSAQQTEVPRYEVGSRFLHSAREGLNVSAGSLDNLESSDTATFSSSAMPAVRNA